MKSILIDPGHGGTDPGARGHGIREKDLNLSVCRELVPLLKRRGITAILTRAGDTGMSLKARTDLAIKHKVDAVMSVHHNAGGGRGIETYRSLFNAGSKRLAELAHAELRNAFPELPNRGVKTRRHPSNSRWDYYHMIREPQRKAGIPAIITETGFVDSAADAVIMKRSNFATTQAEALARGICAFFGVPWSKPAAPAPDGGLYRVQVGAFGIKANAVACMERAKAAGFKDAFIVGGAAATAPAPAPAPKLAPAPTIKVGSRVKVKSGAKDYNGVRLASFVFAQTYDVIQITGDRVVIGQGKTVTAAVRLKDLTLV